MFSILTRKALLLSLSLLLGGCVFIQPGERIKIRQEAPRTEEKAKSVSKKESSKDAQKPNSIEQGKETETYYKQETPEKSSEQPNKNHEEEPDIIDELLKELETVENRDKDKVFTFPELVEDMLDIRYVESVKPDIWPVMGFVTSKFGWRKRGRRTKKFHAGIDISAPYGSPVVATSAGKVIYAGWIRGYGNVVIIYHGYGFTTLYAHMSSLAVRGRDYVIKGQVIGYVGRTGRATGSHLHYEVLKYGIRQNPILFLP